MIIEGRALVIPGDDIDTDVLYPGPYLNIDRPEEMAEHLFEGLDPSLRERVEGDTVLVVGSNFGIGSSREHVVRAMRALGVRALVGRSFARIFFRNCINLGLPAVQCPAAAEAIDTCAAVRIDLTAGRLEAHDTSFTFNPFPSFLMEILSLGGLEPWVRQQLER